MQNKEIVYICIPVFIICNSLNYIFSNIKKQISSFIIKVYKIKTRKTKVIYINDGIC